MLDQYIEPEDYKEDYCRSCDDMYDRLDRCREDFGLLFDMVQGRVRYDSDQWMDSLEHLNVLFGTIQPLIPPIFVKPSKMYELKLDEEILRQAMCI